MGKRYYVYQCTAVFPYSVLVEARDEEEARDKAYSLFRQDIRRGEVIHKDTFPAFNVTLRPLLTAERFGRPYEAPQKKRKTYAEDFKEHFGYTWGEAYSSLPCRYELYDRKECDRTEKTHPGSCFACWNAEMEADDEL